MDLQKRMERLEKHNRLLKVFGLIIISLALLGTQGAPKKTSWDIYDRRGELRATFGLDKSGEPRLALFDKGGNEALVLHADRPSLILKDKNGKERLSLGLERDWSPHLRYYNKNGREQGVFAVIDGYPRLTLNDENGELRAIFILGRTGNPQLNLHDENGNTRSSLFIDNRGTPGLVLYDKDRKMRGAFAVNPDGEPQILIWDKDRNILFKAH